MQIGAIARLAKVPASTIRYYERIGLLRPSTRSRSGYRLYSDRAVDEMCFIRRAQTLGFSLSEIAEILELGRAGAIPCNRVIAMARSHLAALKEQRKQLARFHRRLGRVVKSWEGKCGFSAKGLCDLIEVSDSPSPRVASGIGRRHPSPR